MRIGWGCDVHRIGGDGPMMLGGVAVESGRGLRGTSDGDVALHALADALLGAAALGDLGVLFPSSDPHWAGADSRDLLARVMAEVQGAGYAVQSVDVTIIAETVRVAPHREAIRAAIGAVLGVDAAQVSVKATTTDGMGFLGRDEGVAATAVAVLTPAG
jgi:2-C-methyl-D-erythritol 2,4-cyclodiphosphate synthase